MTLQCQPKSDQQKQAIMKLPIQSIQVVLCMSFNRSVFFFWLQSSPWDCWTISKSTLTFKPCVIAIFTVLTGFTHWKCHTPTDCLAGSGFIGGVISTG